MARVNQVQIDEAIANFQYEGILVGKTIWKRTY